VDTIKRSTLPYGTTDFEYEVRCTDPACRYSKTPYKADEWHYTCDGPGGYGREGCGRRATVIGKYFRGQLVVEG
jgi:hypothetical protein